VLYFYLAWFALRTVKRCTGTVQYNTRTVGRRYPKSYMGKPLSSLLQYAALYCTLHVRLMVLLQITDHRAKFRCKNMYSLLQLNFFWKCGSSGRRGPQKSRSQWLRKLDQRPTPGVFYTNFYKHARRLRLKKPTVMPDILNHFWIQVAISLLKPPHIRFSFRSEAVIT
jgi:hypothetical protein